MKSIFLCLILAGVVTACSDTQRANMENSKLESFKLTSSESEIAEALIEGYKNDTGMNLLRSQDYARAACYAKTVNMPDRHYSYHMAYLANYSRADKQWDNFWRSLNMSERTAYDMAEIFRKAYARCE